MDYDELFNSNPYDKTIRIKSAKLKKLKEHKTKSAAAFLDEIIDEYFKPNLFKRKK